MREKATFLGQCLGAVVLDTARIDEETLWVNLIGRLERPHLKVAFLFKNQSNNTSNNISDRLTPESAGQILGIGPIVMPLTEDLQALGILVRPGPKGISIGGPGAYGEALEIGPLFDSLVERLEQAKVTESSL